VKWSEWSGVRGGMEGGSECIASRLRLKLEFEFELEG